MSCEADKKAMATASAPSAAIDAVGSMVDMPAQTRAKSTCVMNNQARRRPSRPGSKRSSKGAHTNLKV